MATQILSTDRPFLLHQSTDPHPNAQPGATHDTTPEKVKAEPGNIFRGLFFALLFNILLVLTIAACWELWRVIR